MMFDLSFILFGLIDNGILLLGSLTGFSLEKIISKTPGFKGAVLGALIGNAISDGIAGIVAGNIPLGIGSFLGCLIPLLGYIIWLYLRKKS